MTFFASISTPYEVKRHKKNLNKKNVSIWRCKGGRTQATRDKEISKSTSVIRVDILLISSAITYKEQSHFPPKTKIHRIIQIEKSYRIRFYLKTISETSKHF